MWNERTKRHFVFAMVGIIGFILASPAAAQNKAASDVRKDNRENLRHHAAAGLAALNILQHVLAAWD